MKEELIDYQGAKKGTKAKKEHLGSRKIKSAASAEGEGKEAKKIWRKIKDYW